MNASRPIEHHCEETMPDLAAELLAALIVLRAEHARVEPHHEDMCALCRQADAAIARARQVPVTTTPTPGGL